jgi:hypothetical protein
MNERIQLLAEQARTYARYYVAECKCHGYYMEHNELEVRFEKKFAELIVKACSNIVFEEGCTEDNPDCPNEELYQLSNKIERYFGVEE